MSGNKVDNGMNSLFHLGKGLSRTWCKGVCVRGVGGILGRSGGVKVWECSVVGVNDVRGDVVVWVI